jgi:hypothetical protein
MRRCHAETRLPGTVVRINDIQACTHQGTHTHTTDYVTWIVEHKLRTVGHSRMCDGHINTVVFIHVSHGENRCPLQS